MASDSNAALSHRRQNSSATSSKILPIHARQRSQSKSLVRPKSSQWEDSFLQAFLDPSFDPTAYLNATLPPLQYGNHSATGSGAGGPTKRQAVPLSELSNEAQTLATQLDAHTTRLSNTLTQLTDDILRSGSRLAYQVELLRGETLSFSETLHEKLQADIRKFLPDGLPSTADTDLTAASGTRDMKAPEQKDVSVAIPPAAAESPEPGLPNEPQCIKQLRTLSLVRDRLDSVINTFGEAMEFVFPPSELSAASGFLSVSAPEPGSGSFGAVGGAGGAGQHSTEEKGQQVLRRLREEITQLLQNGKAADGSDDPVAGIERAAERVEALKTLATVWKGTAEEKGRTRFIETLAKMVEDRHKELLKEAEAAARREGDGAATGSSRRPRKGSVKRESVKAEEEKSYLTGYGLMSQLQKLRSGL
ncbi:hypothetical protein SODALDRAFT_327762 [Sodiomyces alkalinus F11]|uniref:Uncharacterized protein n=1 Tax=Sodiomyces alkalinus (strain CBS 110278 / VKM F-3762 / F11) TaxID=1314773 RepID=A0A3N2Q9Y4_SODAK|nr:hypothetical protein SODALDRAFT_327762 [Sodiomyces alkalinus F11]ROT43561.1 hypothetical protein SODALDRAFT_327762 [Sodiomyces alkalinus F11]